MGINETPIGGLLAGGKVVSGALAGKPLGLADVDVVSSVYTITLTGTFVADKLNTTVIATAITDKQFVTAAQTADDTIVVKGWDKDGAAADTDFCLNVYRKD